MKQYDYLLVGSGLFAGVSRILQENREKNVWCWKKGHLGGNHLL